MLELRNVSKTFSGIKAVDNVSFLAHRGEVTGYLGPNGSGKSTTMKMISGLIEMSGGLILFDGQSFHADPIEYKQRMGYVPEEPHLYAHLSALEYLSMVAELRHLSSRPTADRIDGLLRLLSLHGDRHAPISAYSRGMRQKVLLAAALLHDPELLLLDEPFSGLDVGTALAHRAWAGLAIAICGTGLAYGLCYFRSLRRIVEEPDILPGTHGFGWLPRFGNSLENAVVQFSIRTLFRSRQHRLILAFYVGFAFAITTVLLKSPVAREPLLASTILIMAFAVLGLRVIFSLPMDLGANWVFRVTPIQPGWNFAKAYRRSLWALAVIPVWVTSAVLLLALWSWQAALIHLVLLGLLGMALVELCLQGNQKIPFTCSWLPGKSSFHITAILCGSVLLLLIVGTADLEQTALQNPRQICIVIAVLALIAGLARWRTWRITRSDVVPLRFEESPSWQLISLNLPHDGGLPAP